MSHIWKAVTGFFKAKEKMEEKKNSDKLQAADDKVVNEDGSDDSDDEDFVPNEANDGALSEEASDDDVDDEDPTNKKKTEKKRGSGRKRKAPKKSFGFLNGARVSKRGRFAEDDNDKNTNDDSLLLEEPTDDVEDVANEEAEEKAETDKLWADFLTSVEEEKVKKSNARNQRTVEKVVNKVYDFAGEKVSVQEKVKVILSNESQDKTLKNGNNDDDELCSSSTFLHSEPTPGTSSATRNPAQKRATVTFDQNDEPKPGPSSAMRLTNGVTDKNKAVTAKPPERRRKGGISILGNDPELIGLDDLEKRGLSGLLKAFQSKSRKIGTLEKSKLDWETFKRQQGLDEELHNHNKSRNTFIDKQEFLQRTDHRQFEIEKSMRATQRSKRLAN